MLFNSFSFVLLVLGTFCLYYVPCLVRMQVPILIAASFIFYAANQPLLLALLLVSVFANALASYAVRHGNAKCRLAYASLGVGVNLAALIFFKYSPLLGRTLLRSTGSVGEFLLAVPLPVGISFYTFQGISLVVDTLRGDGGRGDGEIVPRSVTKHVTQTVFFISFFPQLVAGPIVRAADFVPQIRPKYLRDVDWQGCFRLLVLGYFFKMVLADNLKDHTFWISYPHFQFRSTATLLAMLLAFSMQIFADFAGYSLIAMGLAKLFGYHLRENFNFPYISRSFAEFWQKWHISLSSFLKDYLYIPVGGNRRGTLRTYVNIGVVMVLGGLWHGAAWSYAVWGTAHGAMLMVERALKNLVRLPDNRLVGALRAAFVFSFVTLAWLLFKLPNFGHAIRYMKAVLANTHLPTTAVGIECMAIYSAAVILYHLWHLAPAAGKARIKAFSETLAYGSMLFLIVTNSGSANAFIYFQF